MLDGFKYHKFYKRSRVTFVVGLGVGLVDGLWSVLIQKCFLAKSKRPNLISLPAVPALCHVQAQPIAFIPLSILHAKINK